MPLMLTLKKGEDFFIGDRRLVLVSIAQDELIFDMDGYGEVLVGKKWGEVDDGIRLSAARLGAIDKKSVRIAVDAPDYKVLRGKLYRDV